MLHWSASGADTLPCMFGTWKRKRFRIHNVVCIKTYPVTLLICYLICSHTDSSPPETCGHVVNQRPIGKKCFVLQLKMNTMTNIFSCCSLSPERYRDKREEGSRKKEAKIRSWFNEQSSSCPRSSTASEVGVLFGKTKQGVTRNESILVLLKTQGSRRGRFTYPTKHVGSSTWGAFQLPLILSSSFPCCGRSRPCGEQWAAYRANSLVTNSCLRLTGESFTE